MVIYTLLLLVQVEPVHLAFRSCVALGIELCGQGLGFTEPGLDSSIIKHESMNETCPALNCQTARKKWVSEWIPGEWSLKCGKVASVSVGN